MQYHFISHLGRFAVYVDDAELGPKVVEDLRVQAPHVRHNERNACTIFELS